MKIKYVHNRFSNYHHILIKTKPLAPKVQWSVISLNKTQRQTESSVTCRSANHLSTAFRLHLIDPLKEGRIDRFNSLLIPKLLFCIRKNSRKKDGYRRVRTSIRMVNDE